MPTPPLRFKRELSFVHTALLLALVTGCARGSDGSAASHASAKPEPSCLVATTNTMRITGADVARVRMAVFPPPSWDESVRLAASAGLASTMPDGQPKEDSDTRGVSPDPWLASYERLTRLVKLNGGGNPTEIATRLDGLLKARWKELGGKLGPCGGPLEATGWTSW